MAHYYGCDVQGLTVSLLLSAAGFYWATTTYMVQILYMVLLIYSCVMVGLVVTVLMVALLKFILNLLSQKSSYGFKFWARIKYYCRTGSVYALHFLASYTYRSCFISTFQLAGLFE